MKRMLALTPVFALALAAAVFAAEPQPAATTTRGVTLEFHTIPLSSSNPMEDRIGRLHYRGGLVIESSDRAFGGLSALAISPDGTKLLSVSDEAHWFRATLNYDAKGRLVGIAHGEMADMRGLDGQVIHGKDGDAEGLAVPGALDGPVLVSFERDHRVWRYDLSKGLDATPQAVAMPDAIKMLESNSGLEGLTARDTDTFLAVAETAQNADGTHPAWLVESGRAETLRAAHHDPYEISDAAFGPDGNLYLLERHYYDPIRGIVIAVREVDGASVKPGAQLEGSEIASFTMRQNIDNMEGIALRRGPKGELLLYLIADDNYNPLERTLLLMFEIEN